MFLIHHILPIIFLIFLFLILVEVNYTIFTGIIQNKCHLNCFFYIRDYEM